MERGLKKKEISGDGYLKDVDTCSSMVVRRSILGKEGPSSLSSFRNQDSTVDARPVTKAFKPISGIGAEDCFARRAVMEGISGSTELLSLSQLKFKKGKTLKMALKILILHGAGELADAHVKVQDLPHQIDRIVSFLLDK